jgi:deoxyribodipyrimidine photo-lyase
LWLYDQIKSKRGKNKESYVEEFVVRRELSINFVWYNKDYDSLKCLPEWAQETLEKHKKDEREKVYSKEELENAETDDPYWNQAMKTMKERGYLHNHMRMYWGKQILIYTNTPQYAHKVALELNNKYFLDGRDPNSFTNIAWLFGKHDRGWTEREVFGKVRTMTKSGLERKIDTEAYLEKYDF